MSITSPALSNQNLPAVSGDAQLLTELNAPFHSGEKYFFMNLAARDAAAEGAATTLGSLPVSEATLELAGQLGTKAYLASNGACLLPESARETVVDYQHYLEAFSLLDGEALQRVVFVADPTRIAESLATLSERGGAEKQVQFYIDTAKALELSSQFFDVSPERYIAARLNDHFSAKHTLRDFFAEHSRLVAPHYPRLFIDAPQGSEPSAKTLALLDACLSYYPHSALEEGAPNRRALFVQAVEGAGGRGNTILFEHSDGSCSFESLSGETKRLASGFSTHELAVLLASEPAPIEVTPFLHVLESRSYSLLITQSGESLLLQRRQLLNEQSQAFVGFVIDRHKSIHDRYIAKIEAHAVSNFARHLAAQGYSGYFDVDTFSYLDSSGALRSAVAEANMRRDGSSFLLSAIARSQEALSRLGRGELSLLMHEHFKIDEGSLFRGGGESGVCESKSLRIAEICQAAGLPLFSPASARGVVLLTPLIKREGYCEIGIGIVSDDDREKYDILSQLFTLFPDTVFPDTVSPESRVGA